MQPSEQEYGNPALTATGGRNPVAGVIAANGDGRNSMATSLQQTPTGLNAVGFPTHMSAPAGPQSTATAPPRDKRRRLVFVRHQLVQAEVENTRRQHNQSHPGQTGVHAPNQTMGLSKYGRGPDMAPTTIRLTARRDEVCVTLDGAAPQLPDDTAYTRYLAYPREMKYFEHFVADAEERASGRGPQFVNRAAIELPGAAGAGAGTTQPGVPMITVTAPTMPIKVLRILAKRKFSDAQSGGGGPLPQFNQTTFLAPPQSSTPPPPPLQANRIFLSQPPLQSVGAMPSTPSTSSAPTHPSWQGPTNAVPRLQLVGLVAVQIPAPNPHSQQQHRLVLNRQGRLVSGNRNNRNSSSNTTAATTANNNCNNSHNNTRSSSSSSNNNNDNNNSQSKS